MVTIHATLLNIFNTGVLLQGESGIGKTDLALDLLTRGHRLIADDSVQIFCEDQKLLGKITEPSLQQFLNIRGIGVVDLKTIFDESILQATIQIELAIYLHANDVDCFHSFSILECELPTLHIPFARQRNLTLLIETAVRHFQVTSKRKNPEDELASLTAKLIEGRIVTFKKNC